MKGLVHARVLDHLARLHLGYVAERIDAMLSEAAKKDTTRRDFLDGLRSEELASKPRKRIAMHVQSARFQAVKTLDDFDFKFQPSIDQKLVREPATGRFFANAENVLVFGAPGVGKTHLAIALGAQPSRPVTLFFLSVQRPSSLPSRAPKPKVSSTRG